MTDAACPYVSRGGLKLAAALAAFEIDVRELVCVDLGSHAGGFVDCLLQAGAVRVYAIDTGYGVLDHRLRQDSRVVPHEKTNALHYRPDAPCDLVTIDVGWTAQRLVLPVARRCLRPDDGQVVTLVKPQYEAPKSRLKRGVVPDDCMDEVLAMCRRDVTALKWHIAGEIASPIRGHGGNREFLWWLRPGAGTT